MRVLEDIEAIKQLKYRYADACDRGYDADTLADLFTEDAIWDGGLFGRYEGREAIREFFARCLHRHPLRHALHDEPDHQRRRRRGHGEWYLFQTCTFAEGNTPIWGAARYEEEYERVDGAWKFRHLKLISSFWTPYEEGWVKRRFVQDDWPSPRP